MKPDVEQFLKQLIVVLLALRAECSRFRSGSIVVIQTHQRSILKTFIRSQSDFLIPFHNSAIAGSPKLSQIRGW
jgi:hypothetical protein